MSVTVLAPTPALPPVRRPSMWEKMFGNFKLGKPEDSEIEPAQRSPNSPRTSKTRLASISTGVDTAKISYKRNASVAMVKESRSCSAPLPQPASPSKTRSASIASIKTRRSSRARRASWWRSANPETDESVPAVPVIDRKYSIFGSHNPDVEAAESDPPSPTSARRPSYVPRNAASSFLKTTTPLSSEEKAEVIRRASVADMRSANTAAAVIKSPAKSHRPAPLNLSTNKTSTIVNNDSTAAYGMFSMAGVCEIEEPYENDPISPRGGASFSAASAPRSPLSPLSVVSAPLSPTDTIMEVDVEIIDSAKNSPELLPTKGASHVAVVELVA